MRDNKLYVPAYPAEYTLPAATAEGNRRRENGGKSGDSASAEALLDDFNTLLAKLKAAGIMVADEET